MANPTTYFGWVMPTSSSLVTNLPADFNTFGQGVDTSLQYLLGGTTGQVLSKTSGTNMAFTWVTPTDQTPLTTKGDLFAFSTVDARLPAGANETRLVADSAQTLGLKYVADTTNYAIAAKADLLVGTAADTLAALTVGTNGQVLTADSTVSPTGLKWATPAAASFIGARVCRNSNQSLSNATETVITWTVESFDTHGFYTSSPNPSRLTIPSGYGGYYLCISQLHYGSSVNGFRTNTIYVNGSTSMAQTEIGTSSRGSSVYAIDIINLAAADYLEIRGYQDSGGSLNVIGDSSNDYTYFTIQKVG